MPAPLDGILQPQTLISVLQTVVFEPCHGLLGCVNCKANSAHDVGLLNTR